MPEKDCHCEIVQKGFAVEEKNIEQVAVAVVIGLEQTCFVTVSVMHVDKVIRLLDLHRLEVEIIGRISVSVAEVQLLRKLEFHCFVEEIFEHWVVAIGDGNHQQIIVIGRQLPQVDLAVLNQVFNDSEVALLHS